MSADKQERVFGRVKRFVSEDIWDVEINSLSWFRRVWINTVRVLHLIYKGFLENECPLHASALTYISLMSIVPIMAFALAVLRGFGAGDKAEQRILQAVAQMPEQFREFVVNILDYVGRTDFATLGGIGLVFLLVTVVLVMGRVERSFNRVWGVSASRNFFRKLSGYISILIVVPVLVMAATTLNAMLTSPGIASLIQARLGPASFIYLRSKTMTPLLATWIAFIFLYKFMPNTRVRPVPAILSGIIGGSLWIMWQWFYINLQVGVTQYNRIYGTFASIPIFLIWLYVSWQIVLLGAEVGFAFQNFATYNMEQRAHSASTQSRILLALSIVSRAARSMLDDLPQFDVASYAKEHLVPVRLINEVVELLVRTGLLAPVADANGRYVMTRLPEKVKIEDIVNVVLESGSSPRSLGLHQLNPAFVNIVDRARVQKEGGPVNIADLVKLASESADASVT